MPSTQEKPVLILIRGLPGSGKTYFAKYLYNSLQPLPITILDPDATDYTSSAYKAHVVQQTQDGVDTKLHPYRFLRQQAYTAIQQHEIIIWNQPFTNLDIMQKVTTRLQEHAQEHGTVLSILVIEVSIDVETAHARVLSRKQNGGHGPSEDTFNRFAHEYETCKSLGYDVITVDGTIDPTNAVNSISEYVASLRK